jgi:choline dehydrogenase
MVQHPLPDPSSVEFAERARRNQTALAADLKTWYDFIVCGSGSSGSVVARRLSDHPDVSVLLLEAGGTDDVPEVTDPAKWLLNLGSDRDWGFTAVPNPRLNGRAIALNMGRVLGGGSSINASVWAHGHKSDWDFFASAAEDDGWNYDSVRAIYRRIEDWHGVPDPKRRGIGGPVYVEPAHDPHPIALAFVAGAPSCGIQAFGDPNGSMMEGGGGAAIQNMRIRDGRRLSLFRTYVYPVMDRPNLTVLSGARVVHVVFENTRAVGVDVSYGGELRRIRASVETILSMGAINTPTLLMQSGVGDQAELGRFGIPVVQHLPGVGRNFQDHVMVGSVFECPEPLVPRNNGGEAIVFWRSRSGLDTPDTQILQPLFPLVTPENARYAPPAASWSLCAGLLRPASRGQIRLTGPGPLDPILIDANTLAEPGDLDILVKGVELCRELAHSDALRPFVKREVMPGPLNHSELDRFIRNGLITIHHQTCTAKMGRDPMSVVDHRLKVYGVERLRIADGSVMPRVTTGNTMAPCVVIGERASEILRMEHKL